MIFVSSSHQRLFSACIGHAALLLLFVCSQPPAKAQSCNQCPQQLAIYYGWPSLVNNSNTDTNLATQVFSVYDVVVFGDTLEFATHPDHARTQTIIQNLKAYNTAVYGYIDLGVTTSNLPLREIHNRTDQWAAMGVAGIFLDQAGYDFAVSRDRQNAAVDYIHGKGLSAFVNIWNPDDAFSPAINPTYNPNGLPAHLGGNDYYLHESFAVTLSQYQDPGFLIGKSDTALAWRDGDATHTAYGTRMATVNTIASSNPPFDQAQFNYVWWMTLLYNFDAMAWGETAQFSSENSQLPYHPRPNPGNIGDPLSPITVAHNPPNYARTTTTGTVEVNTSTHVGQFTQP